MNSPEYTDPERVSYFTRYVLEEQSGSVSIDTVKQRAAEENLDIDMATFDSELRGGGDMYEIDRTQGSLTITGVTPRGDCPETIALLYENLRDGPSVEDVAGESFEDEATTLSGNSEISDLGAVSDAKVEAMNDRGYDTLDDVLGATVEELAQVPSIPLPEARKIKQQAELASDPADQLAREALARDLGLDVSHHNTPDIETLVEQGRDGASSADVISMDMVKQEPGEPIRVSEEWDGEDWHFQNLPILNDVDHPLVPDMEGAVEPKEISLPTGESISEVVCNTLARGEKGVLLEGPHGCGKNYLINWIMWKTNRPVISIDLNESMLAEHLIGSMMPQEDGSVAFEDKLIPYCAKYGITPVFNEIRAAPPDVTMALHQLLENGEMVIEESGERITPHPAFRFIATTNPNTVEYDGAGSLNDAFLDRLRIVPADYLAPAKEIDLLDDRFNQHRQVVSRNVIKSFVSVANETRDDRSVPTLSTRQLEDAIYWTDENGNPRGTLKTIIKGRADRRSKLESLEQYVNDTVPKSVTSD